MSTTTLIRTLSLVLLMALFLTFPAPASAQVGVGVVITVGPPLLPIYEQPICPGEDYIWVPGYWGWDADFDDYYWVPGTWVLAPEVGFFWTPGYWSWGGASFVFIEGYWGPVVGFYGGVNYGFGYFGRGYEGGRWEGGHFFYNRAVNNVNVTVIHNTYETTVVNNNVTVNRVSYNGGRGGLDVRPSPGEEAAARARHLPPVAAQTRHVQEARSQRELRASVNHGAPPIAATPKPAAFKDRGVVPARGTNEATPAETRSEGNASRPSSPGHARDLTPHEKMVAPNTGNPKTDQKYQKQQEKLAAQQEKDHQKIQQQQDREHQRVEKQQADEAKRQQMEQRHQQQTQQMEQRHVQQRQQLEQRQQPRPAPEPSRAPAPSRAPEPKR